MKRYFRIMLGARSVHAAECRAGNFIGADYGINQDLSKKLPEEWREFNRVFIPEYQSGHPDKTKIAAGLACGFLWTISKGIQKGDIVLCPDGSGKYYVGEGTGWAFGCRPNLTFRGSVHHIWLSPLRGGVKLRCSFNRGCSCNSCHVECVQPSSLVIHKAATWLPYFHLNRLYDLYAFFLWLTGAPGLVLQTKHIRPKPPQGLMTQRQL